MEVDLTGKVPPMPPWRPILVDQVPDDPGEDMHYVVLPLPDEPAQWMLDNVPNPSSYIAVMFVPTNLVDIDQLRKDLREFEGGPMQTFPANYCLIGKSTTMGHAFNVVLPKGLI